MSDETPDPTFQDEDQTISPAPPEWKSRRQLETEVDIARAQLQVYDLVMKSTLELSEMQSKAAHESQRSSFFTIACLVLALGLNIVLNVVTR